MLQDVDLSSILSTEAEDRQGIILPLTFCFYVFVQRQGKECLDEYIFFVCRFNVNLRGEQPSNQPFKSPANPLYYCLFGGGPSSWWLSIPSSEGDERRRAHKNGTPLSDFNTHPKTKHAEEIDRKTIF